MKVLHVLAVALLLAAGTSLAHMGADEESAEELTIRFSPQTAPLRMDVVYTAEVFEGATPVTGARVDFVFDLHPRGISDRVQSQEREPGHYFAHYTIGQLHPEWEAHVEVLHEGHEVHTTHALSAVSAGGWEEAMPGGSISAAAMASAGLVLVLAGLALYLRRK